MSKSFTYAIITKPKDSKSDINSLGFNIAHSSQDELLDHVNQVLDETGNELVGVISKETIMAIGAHMLAFEKEAGVQEL